MWVKNMAPNVDRMPTQTRDSKWSTYCVTWNQWAGSSHRQQLRTLFCMSDSLPRSVADARWQVPPPGTLQWCLPGNFLWISRNRVCTTVARLSWEIWCFKCRLQWTPEQHTAKYDMIWHFWNVLTWHEHDLICSLRENSRFRFWEGSAWSLRGGPHFPASISPKVWLLRDEILKKPFVGRQSQRDVMTKGKSKEDLCHNA